MRPPFGATYLNQPLTDSLVAAYCGVGPPLTADPELEWLEAGLSAGYKPHEFDALEIGWQAIVLARYRVRRRIDAIAAHWQSEEAKRNAK